MVAAAAKSSFVPITSAPQGGGNKTKSGGGKAYGEDDKVWFRMKAAVAGDGPSDHVAGMV